MERQDSGLAFMLQYDNIARFDGGKVYILDRRIYPEKTQFVCCEDHKAVARALTDMVTQSAGPYTAGPMGVALAAWECRDLGKDAQIVYLEDAANTIANARPTTSKRMALLCGECVDAAIAALEAGGKTWEAVIDKTVELNNERYESIGKIAKYLVEKFPDGGHVMTYCFAETIVGMMLKECRRVGKSVKLFCPETRPYFQGARLTATVCRDMGFDVTVISDGMPAFVMQNEGIDVFTTAADAICCDGYVVNKVGTCNTAIVAKHFGVPYYATGAPDGGHPTVDTIKIELRDPEFTLQAMGVRTAAEGVKGYYPAFDITPPELVTGVVTDRGVFSPYELAKYFRDSDERIRVVV